MAFAVLKFGLGLSDTVVLPLMVILAIALPLALMRPFKATLVALQYHHGAAEGRLDQ